MIQSTCECLKSRLYICCRFLTKMSTVGAFMDFLLKQIDQMQLLRRLVYEMQKLLPYPRRHLPRHFLMPTLSAKHPLAVLAIDRGRKETNPLSSFLFFFQLQHFILESLYSYDVHRNVLSPSIFSKLCLLAELLHIQSLSSTLYSNLAFEQEQVQYIHLLCSVLLL